MGLKNRVQDRAAQEEELQKDVTKFIEYSNIVQNDKNLGVPEAQAAMEVIKNFNRDMTKIQGKMSELLTLFNTIN